MSITLSLPDRPLFGLSDTELLTHLDEITTAERALAAARLRTVAELSARGVPAAHGYAHPTAFLREHLKLHPAAAGQMHRLAGALPGLPDVADALAKGAISEAQAAIINTAIGAIAGEATIEEQTQAAALLVSQAAVLAPKELAVCGNRILHHVAPETAEQRDRAAVKAAERDAWDARALSINPDGHGRVRLRGSTTAEGAALLHAILDPLSHPRRHTADGDGGKADTGTSGAGDSDPGSTGDSDPGSTGAGAGGEPRDESSGEPADAGVPHAFRDPRSAAQRRHDALLDALRLLLAADALPDNGGNKPQIAVLVGFDPLTRELGTGQLDTGAPLSPEEVRRLACDAGILPAILDSHSVPLDLGRQRRLISGALRKALIIRDRGCAWPGCDRPPRWCQGHVRREALVDRVEVRDLHCCSVAVGQ